MRIEIESIECRTIGTRADHAVSIAISNFFHRIHLNFGVVLHEFQRGWKFSKFLPKFHFTACFLARAGPTDRSIETFQIRRPSWELYGHDGFSRHFAIDFRWNRARGGCNGCSLQEAQGPAVPASPLFPFQPMM